MSLKTIKSNATEFSGEAANRISPSEGAIRIDSPFLKDIKVKLEARLGMVEVTVQEMLALRNGSVLALDTPLTGTVDLILNQAVVARCEIVSVDQSFGLRVQSILEPESAIG